MGDIHLRLYPEECPKTVENFTMMALVGNLSEAMNLKMN
jgi:cyclophilin family peptidyl-prolyl cis-trans isomerase